MTRDHGDDTLNAIPGRSQIVTMRMHVVSHSLVAVTVSLDDIRMKGSKIVTISDDRLNETDNGRNNKPVDRIERMRVAMISPDLSLRDRTRAYLEALYDGLIRLSDLPDDHRRRVTTYDTNEQLYNALMSHISAIQNFAIDLGLLSVEEARAMHAAYQSSRPDIFRH